ncbi:MAG TPA: FAD-dependent oxidoreductase [Dehalococcoidia bacterium]|nr:FAD-dependent oxidoreductase [Dehalococcoidia bacterium]
MLQKTATDPRFPKLFTPGYIGKMWVKNRIVKSPICSRLANSDGYVTERMVNHYRELAQGGVGVVTVGYAYVDEKASQAVSSQLCVSKDDVTSGLDWLAAAIKDSGARACQQIAHCGMVGKPPIKAASPISFPLYFPVPDPAMFIPEELTTEEVKEIVRAFGDAAFRVMMAGFDMVEVHGAHGYLITNFLSPHYNKRTDCYGGSLINRMRFLLEIIGDIRQKVGGDYPVSVRLSGTDYAEEEPITIEETKEVAKALEKLGVDVIHVSGGGHYTIASGEGGYDRFYPLARNVWAADEIKQVVSIPVIASVLINTPELAEKILEEGKADFVGLARPLLADPYLPLKAKEGRPEDIRPCVRCCDCLVRGVGSGSLKCAVNPGIGREGEFRITQVDKPKKVAVIGGGPAGMEAARVAALRGHEVTLFERKELGGMLIPASVPEFKTDIRRLIKYLSTQVEKAGVNLVKGEVTSQTIKNGKFDAVIVATGATPWLPDVPGIDKSSVVGVLDVLGGTQTGKSVIVVGGGMIASDVILFLAEQGKRVTITTRGDAIGLELGMMIFAFMKRLLKQDVDIRTGVHLVEVTDSGIVIADRSGEKSEIKGDSVVIAAGLTPNRKLFDELAQVPELDEVYAIGDCVEPRTIFDVIREAYAVAFNLI